MKYIIFKSEELAQEFPVIFPIHFIHAEVAMALRSLGCFKNLEVVSAGELSLIDSELNCSGKSDTLNVKSRTQDSLIIRTHDYYHGIL